jgi:hypothetical protein
VYTGPSIILSIFYHITVLYGIIIQFCRTIAYLHLFAYFLQPFPTLPTTKLFHLRTSFPLVRIYDHCSKAVQRKAQKVHFPQHIVYVYAWNQLPSELKPRNCNNKREIAQADLVSHSNKTYNLYEGLWALIIQQLLPGLKPTLVSSVNLHFPSP